MSALLAFVCAACMAKYQHASFVPKAASIRPGKVVEECFDFQSGEGLRFAYESSKPLAFNLHYHEAGKVLMPVPETTSASVMPQRFVADKAQTYCLMWTNQSKQTIKLQYRYVAEYHLVPQAAE